MHPKGADSTAVSELSLRNTLVGSKWVSIVLLFMNGLTNSPLALNGAHFLRGSISPSLSERLLAESHDYYQ